MTVRLIALDLDGTTLNSRGELSPATREALEKAMKRDVQVVIATGRCYSALPHDVVQVPGIHYAITSNGAQMWDLKNGSLMYSNCIDPEAIDHVAELLSQYNYMIEVFFDGNAYIEKSHYEAVLKGQTRHRSKEYVRITRRPTDGVLKLMRKNKDRVENINIFFDNLDEKAAMWKPLCTLEKVTLTSSFDNNWEIGGATTSKGQAVEELCRKLNIHSRNVMACGDSPNDADMLSRVGVPVAVGNAKDVIKNLAVFITGTNDEDGVAQVIDKYVLMPGKETDEEIIK